MKKKVTNSEPDYYTDPIVYEEGFFKDKEDEAKFLAKLGRLANKWKAERLEREKRGSKS